MGGRRGVIGTAGAVAAAAALAAACSAPAGGGPAAVAEAATAAKPGLVRYASCERFAADARARTLRFTGPWGIGGARPVAGRLAAPAAADASGAAEGAAQAAPREGVDFSGTNVQEAGVDEPDLVETDGRTVFAIADGAVRFTDVSGGAPRALAPAFTPDGATPTGLLLHGDRLVVIGETATAWGRPAPAGATIIDADAALTVPWTPPRAVLVQLDVADPAHPRVVTRTTVDGAVVGARRTGDTLRVVLSTPGPRIPVAQPAAGTRAAERAAARANRRAVRRARAGAWLPRMRVRDVAAGTVTTRPAVGCDGVSRPTRFAGVGMLTVLTLDVPGGLRVLDSNAVMTDGQLVYASPTALYVATPRWVDPAAAAADAPPRGSTLIHKLDTSDPARTTYRASGVVSGWLIGQFAMSEHEGRLRVASTEEPARWTGEGEPDSESRVTVLAESGRRLVREGLVTGLGRGERIHAVRFMGDRGYVVTFRRVDPLYVVDLSDPARPVVRGELKIPGFSSYLHPVGDDLLVGIGQAATAQGRTTGTQVSLFDVSDPAAPRRIARHALDSDWSEAESDHHAVLWWPARRLLVVPVERWGASGPAVLGAVGLDVGPDTGITPVARVRHPVGEGWYTPVRRALVAGGSLITVSDDGIMASDLATLAPRGWLAFP